MKNVELKINGKAVSVPEGTTILAAAKAAGIRIPTLCAYEGMRPHAACRLCIVEVEGESEPKLSCAVKVADGMVVTTDTSELFSKRKELVTEMFRQHTVECMHCTRIGGSRIEDLDPKICENCYFCDCERDGFCELQALSREFGISELPFEIHEYDFEKDESTGSVIRDANKCVKCRRCVDACKAQGVGILGIVKTENGQTVGVKSGAKLAESDCVRCGRCVEVCPTGALYLREHIDEILYRTHSYDTKTAVMLGKPVVERLEALYGESFSYEQLVAAMTKLGFDHVFCPDWAKNAANEEAAKILSRKLGKGTVILTNDYAAKNYLTAKHPELRKSFAFYSSPMALFSAKAKELYPEIKTVLVGCKNSLGAECAETGAADYFVNERELFRLLKRTGANPAKRAEEKAEKLADFKPCSKYPELLGAAEWSLGSAFETLSFEVKGKTCTAAICHNLAQAEKAVKDLEKFDVIKVIA